MAASACLAKKALAYGVKWQGDVSVCMTVRIFIQDSEVHFVFHALKILLCSNPEKIVFRKD